MIILGIDPGTTATGYGLIKKDGNFTELLNYGLIAAGGIKNSGKVLRKIFYEIKSIIDRFKPDEAVVEKIFFNKNVKTVMQVSEARGVILLAFEECGIPVFEYTPLQVKKSLTGYGRATKEEIQKILKLILKLNKTPRPDDAADAIAIALCHAAHSNFLKRIENT